MTLHEALFAISIYPTPSNIVDRIISKRGLKSDETMNVEKWQDKTFRLAESDVYEYLSSAPEISQGGITYSLSDQQRAEAKAQCNAIRVELGEAKSQFGYKGTKL